MATNIPSIKTLGDLLASSYKSRSVKDEMRENLVELIKSGKPRFQGIHGFDDTVIPDLERAVLSRHNMILLGLRGQAKTRIARLLIELLDEYIPAIDGVELMDDPTCPISREAMDIVEKMGDKTPIRWIHRQDRYTEKLATPDVSVADLIGDVDPIKAANLKLSYSDERVIHFGLVPRAHRGLFVINELPDLQPRIQVSLFNILQEGDIQIRGFKLRLPLDIQFVFTANPEDYTNRGSIVTPLKDRIESQILTHYPKDIETSRSITDQEARLTEDQKSRVALNDIAIDMIEQLALEARDSEYVDEKSGVSARMTISAREILVSSAERRALLNGENSTHIRVSDFWGVIPAMTGKVELVYEGEQEGPFIVALNLLGKAIRSQFINYFPDPEQRKRNKESGDPYSKITDWFGDGNQLDILQDVDDATYRAALDEVPGLDEVILEVEKTTPTADKYFLKEFVLHGLAEYSLLSKGLLASGTRFGDLLSSMLSGESVDEDIF
ncbi:MAG: magnesium chelatase subunit I [Limisphaerales bacterium]|jgi:magnesium chelatase subunit I